MIRRSWMLGAAAAAVLCVWTTTGRADDDTLRLDLKKGKDAATMNLLGAEADTEDVAWRGGWGGWRGGWRGGWGGWGGWGWHSGWRGYGWGGWGGYGVGRWGYGGYGDCGY